MSAASTATTTSASCWHAADGGFSVIDFEGEPARPLDRAAVARITAARRGRPAAQPGLRGAHRGARRHPAFDADAWLLEARAAFLHGAGVIGPDETPLLDAFELEKACYEVRYEASNRPDWLWLPLAALERMSSAS